MHNDFPHPFSPDARHVDRHVDRVPDRHDRHDDRPGSSDLSQQFWGDSRGWVSGDQPAVTPRRRRREATAPTEVTGSIQAIRDGFAAFRPQTVGRRNDTAQIERTRAHGIVRPAEPTTTDAHDARLPRREATIAQLGAGWFDEEFDEALAVMRSERTAAHRVVAAHAAQPDDAYREPVRHDGYDGVDHGYDDPYDIPLTSTDRLADRLGIAAVDPLLMRLGIFVLALMLLLPIAWSMRDGDGDAGSIESNGTIIGSGSAAVLTPTITLPPETYSSIDASPAASTTAGADASAVAVEASTSSAATSTSGQAAESDTPIDTAIQSAGDVVQNETAGATPAVDEPATVDAAAERQQLECALTYTAGPGDSWYRIASAAGITPNEVLAPNLATVDSVIFPGDEICLPAGSTMPTAPTTAPATTAAPTTTDAPTTTTAPPTTAAPSTTEAPSPPPPTSTTAEVQAMIREIWPDELEEKALAIAWRESGYQATADNGWCCVGVFQIYWTVHDSWLDDFGIYTRNDLKDARKNITAAYALYQRSGGWGPWGG